MPVFCIFSAHDFLRSTPKDQRNVDFSQFVSFQRSLIIPVYYKEYYKEREIEREGGGGVLTWVLEAEPQLEAVVAIAGAQDAQVALPAGLLVAAAPRRRPLPGVAVPDSLHLSLQESGLPGWGVKVSPWCQGVKNKTIGELDHNIGSQAMVNVSFEAERVTHQICLKARFFSSQEFFLHGVMSARGWES